MQERKYRQLGANPRNRLHLIDFSFCDLIKQTQFFYYLFNFPFGFNWSFFRTVQPVGICLRFRYPSLSAAETTAAIPSMTGE